MSYLNAELDAFTWRAIAGIVTLSFFHAVVLATTQPLLPRTPP